MIRLSEIIGGQQSAKTVDAPVFKKEYDVIVCGLGTAGAHAAIFCAENGLSVLGVEAFTCLGGTHTAGGIWSPYFGCPGGRYEALDNEIDEFTKRYTFTPPESRKLLSEEALIAKGADILYEATACGVYLEDQTVIGLRVLTENGIEAYGAKIIMDCTADACIATMAGCETQYGRDRDGQVQPYTLVSMIERDENYRFSNKDFGRVNQYDQRALSDAILYARACDTSELIKRGRFVAHSPLFGLREGRRIVPEETVRLEEVFADKQTAEPMFYSYADLDKHGWDIAFDSEVLGDWAIGANLGAYNVTIAVPYKAILPKEKEGILVPCRALGVDRDISSCVRMLLDMKKLAECAAEWATLAILQNQKLREVPYEQIREKLLQSGCLDERYNRGYRIDGAKNLDRTPLIPENVYWITDPTKLEVGLRTEKPGQAIWSAKRMGKEALPVLQQYLTETDENLKKHSAFAIASIGSNAAGEVLRDMVLNRDGLMLKDCRKNNNLRGCIAIYWLGRLCDREIATELMELISNPEELNKPVYHQEDIQTTRYKISGYEDIYFQFMSQSVMALVRIGDAHPDLRPQIRQAFEKAFSTDDYYDRITKKPKLSSEGNMTLAMKTVAFSAADCWQEQK